MKSTDKIAKEIGVDPEAIEKRLNPEFTRQFSAHIEKKDGNVYFDAEVEEFLRLLFNKSDKPHESVATWLEEAVGWKEEIVDPGVEEAKEEAALAKEPQLPAVRWTQLPAVRAITMPLSYRPDMLVQALDAQRRELNEFLNQFDRLVEQLVPSDWGGDPFAAGKSAKRRPIRLVGTTAR